MGDRLCDAFAPPEWKAIDDRWHRREIGLAEAQRQMWALVRCSPAEFDAETDRCALRPGFDDLLERAKGLRLVIASGGFERYIRRLLGPRLDRFEAVYANTLECRDGGVEVAFPHPDLSCGACAICKGNVCDRYEGPVIFAGDGSSDRCAIGRADVLYTVRGSKLERWATAAGVEAIPFDTFDDLRL